MPISPTVSSPPVPCPPSISGEGVIMIDTTSAGVSVRGEMATALIAHRRRRATELRRFAITLRDHPDAPLIHVRADRLEAIALRAERSL